LDNLENKLTSKDENIIYKKKQIPTNKNKFVNKVKKVDLIKKRVPEK